jgi:hydroxylamine reductase (hybrid-cluster protein)
MLPSVPDTRILALLFKLALDMGVEIGERTNNEIALDIAKVCENGFGKQEGELIFIKNAPLKRQEIWRKLGVVPRGIDREVVELIRDQVSHAVRLDSTDAEALKARASTRSTSPSSAWARRGSRPPS